jgi:hypothetical protein
MNIVAIIKASVTVAMIEAVTVMCSALRRRCWSRLLLKPTLPLNSTMQSRRKPMPSQLMPNRMVSAAVVAVAIAADGGAEDGGAKLAGSTAMGLPPMVPAVRRQQRNQVMVGKIELNQARMASLIPSLPAQAVNISSLWSSHIVSPLPIHRPACRSMMRPLPAVGPQHRPIRLSRAKASYRPASVGPD